MLHTHTRMLQLLKCMGKNRKGNVRYIWLDVTHVECALLRQLRLPLAPRPAAIVQVSGPGQRPMAGGSGKGYSLHELPFTVEQPC
jgi:hypothetical protein